MNKSGFTIIETLVAISVLMIAVAGPLVVAHRGLNAALHARDQSIATFLAQEALEVARNVKDNGNWGAVTGCTNTNRCDINKQNYSIRQTVGVTEYPIYLSSSGYNSDSGGSGTQTIFKRFIVAESVSPRALAEEAKVTVTVKWNQGTIQNQVNLSSIFINERR